ncbi:hypothetical protein EUX98_g804 [Antrodiella citrinella]|uniref:Zn(2)-C6 fungal-type domain-containing protein n=1 Tax=Antrodiella citrinella TaxID=2447956 RepID=A0A4S4NBL2_9APHY|nr:hypothetical protein EUX98_g804 [Antrodiella citrinella]
MISTIEEDLMFGQDFSIYVQYPPLPAKDLPATFHYPPLGSPLSQASASTRSSMSPNEEELSSTHYFSSTNSNTWKPADDMEVSMLQETLSGIPEDFLLRASDLYPPLSATTSRASTPMSHRSSAKASKAKPRSSKLLTRPGSISSNRSSVDETNAPSEGAPTKRRRVSPSILPNGRPNGACTRCKKLKMKCSFDEGASDCARCTVNGHECVVLGRKPRSPGLREVLQKQIREKDAQIDELLSQMNPTPSLATPLSIIPSRLALTDSQRFTYRDALAWLEKAQSCSKSDMKAKIDVSFLEDGSDSDLDSDDNMSLDDDLQSSSSSSTQFTSLPGASAPAGVLAAVALESRHRAHATTDMPPHLEGLEPSQDLKIEGGIGSKAYFQPGPSANLDLRRLIIERQAAPDILLSGLVTCEDVGILFDLYFKWINPFIPVLDENIHTPAAVLGRCPFLFTVVCALASRYYDAKPEMYGVALHLAKAAAANAFLDGWKTIEMCQAYILLGAYIPPARRWEEDRYWFFTGIAFRLGIELNLNRMPTTMPTDERNERELLNRLRTWIICYIMDRCICVNLGKPFMVPEDEIIRSAATKFLGFKFQHAGDAYLVSLVEVLRIITRFAEVLGPVMDGHQDLSAMASGLHSSLKVELQSNTGNNRVLISRSENEVNRGEPAHVMQTALMHSVFQYCRLVIFSAGLQQVVKMGALKDDTLFFTGCLQASSSVLNLMIDGLIPTGFIRHCPEQVFSLTAFATVVLLKCLRREFSTKLDLSQEDRIINLVKRLISLLDEDPDRADEQRITRRYSRFVQHILDAHIADLQRRRAKPVSDGAPVTQITSPCAPALMETEEEAEIQADVRLQALPTPWEEMFPTQNLEQSSPFMGVMEADYMSLLSLPDDDPIWFSNFNGQF